jgi:hypothetical protein
LGRDGEWGFGANLDSEVNQLRRTNEALREEIRAKDAEIARLKR